MEKIRIVKKEKGLAESWVIVSVVMLSLLGGYSLYEFVVRLRIVFLFVFWFVLVVIKNILNIHIFRIRFDWEEGAVYFRQSFRERKIKAEEVESWRIVTTLHVRKFAGKVRQRFVEIELNDGEKTRYPLLVSPTGKFNIKDIEREYKELFTNLFGHKPARRKDYGYWEGLKYDFWGQIWF